MAQWRAARPAALAAVVTCLDFEVRRRRRRRAARRRPAAATSATEIALAGSPRTDTRPSAISRSSGAGLEEVRRHVEHLGLQLPGAVQRRAAGHGGRPAAAGEARTGPTSLSPTTTRTCSNGTPNSSAAIWARVVSWPCPCGIWPVKSDHGAVVGEPQPHLLLAQRPLGALGRPRARGRPRCRWPRRCPGTGPGPAPRPGGAGRRERRPAAAMRSSDSRAVTPARLAPGDHRAAGGLVRGATLRSRISRGSRPSSLAIRSMTRSRTNVSAAHGPR